VLFGQGKCYVRNLSLSQPADSISSNFPPLVALGSPGSGCSPFLKTLTNQRAEYHLVEAEVHHDTLSRGHFQALPRRRYVLPRGGVHFPTLTVDETLRFAAKMRAPHTRIEERSRGSSVTTITDIMETIFGMRHVKNTSVGDTAIRGRSGGEEKHVTISEALTPRSTITAWDKYGFLQFRSTNRTNR
jgi:ATP-binding cassette subfamily G (WHITE) protein 2 (SNQ2)